MSTCLITGASRGLGLEFARQYAAEGWRVLATCRDPNTAGPLAALAGDVSVHALDVADFAKADQLAKTLKGTSIDVLINNAGIYGQHAAPFDRLDYDTWADVLRINTLAPLKVSAAFVDHVARSEGKRIVTVSSKMGSIDDNTSGGSYAYRSAKAAVNAAMKSLAIDLRPRRIIVAVLNPGWVRTDMGGPNASIGAEESVAGMRRVIDGLSLADTGRFFDFNGASIPW
jgi:NAD(P)-dependent dehydrogenase (short-subunit alcohol dehydrogenase family)